MRVDGTESGRSGEGKERPRLGEPSTERQSKGWSGTDSTSPEAEEMRREEHVHAHVGRLIHLKPTE